MATELGTVPVEGGASQIPFTLPGAGPYVLEMTAAPSGTVVTVPIQVLAAQSTAPSTPPTTSATPTTTSAAVITKTVDHEDRDHEAHAESAGEHRHVHRRTPPRAVGVAAALIAVGGVLVLVGRRRSVPGRHQG